MQTGIVTPRQNRTARTDRGMSPAIWADCPVDRIREGALAGRWIDDDFLRRPITVPTTEAAYGPDYRGFTSTGGTINIATNVKEGAITLGSDGDDESASIQQLGAPFRVDRLMGKLWFEARVKVDTISTLQYDAFVGLMELATLTATVPITATGGLMADQNFVGFHRSGVTTTGAGSALITKYKANTVTAVAVETVSAALVADTYIKLGMVFDPVDNRIRFFLDNVERATNKLIPTTAGDDFPNDVNLAVTAGVTNTAGSVTSLFTMDWWRCYQLDA